MVELNKSLVPTPSVELQKVLLTHRSASCCISSSRLDCEMDVIPPVEISLMGISLMRLQSATPLAEEAAASTAASAAPAAAPAAVTITTAAVTTEVATAE